MIEVTVFSTIAAALNRDEPGAYPSTSWTGEVPDPDLDEVYRFFNRVPAADSRRLDRIGYELPSLSVGDEFAIGPRRWRVERAGFSEIADATAVARL